MHILICGTDTILYSDSSGKVYVDRDYGWWNRFFIIKEPISIAAIGADISSDANSDYLSLNDKIELNSFVRLNKAKNARDYISNYRYNKHKLEKIIPEVDAIILRYQGFSAFLVCKLARRYHKKIMLELGVDQWDAFWNHGFLGKLVAFPLFLVCKYDIKKADYVHYVTEKYLQKRYPTEGKAIGLSNVDLPQLSQNVFMKRQEKIQHTGKYIIGTAAAVNVKYKGQENVIRALRILRDSNCEDFEYQLVGKGDATYLRTIAKKEGVIDKVSFLGCLSHNDIFEWLDSIDIYIQPSLQEGLPRALIEAMSRGIPCLGTNTAGIPELLNAEFIYKRNKNMPKEIVEKLLAIANKETMKRASEYNYEKSMKFQKSIIEEKRKDFYSHFLFD